MIKKTSNQIEYSSYQDGYLKVPSMIQVWFKSNNVYKVYLTRGIGGCLFLFTDKQWVIEENNLRSMLNVDSNEFKRLNSLFLGSTEVIQIKKSDYTQMPLSEVLRSFAGIEEKAVFVSLQKRIEIWNENVFEKHN